MNNKTIMQYKQFRVFPMVAAARETIDVMDGLAIEYNCSKDTEDKDHYIVIAFVTPDKDGVCSYESVGDRIEKYCSTWEDVQIFRLCLKIAMEEIEKAWRKKHYDR